MTDLNLAFSNRHLMRLEVRAYGALRRDAIATARFAQSLVTAEDARFRAAFGCEASLCRASAIFGAVRMDMEKRAQIAGLDTLKPHVAETLDTIARDAAQTAYCAPFVIAE